jgi:hypothetical protein
MIGFVASARSMSAAKGANKAEALNRFDIYLFSLATEMLQSQLTCLYGDAESSQRH